jgi:hypothetical protein
MAHRVALVSLIALCSGCMSFNGKELPKREFPSAVAETPVVALEVGDVKLTRNGSNWSTNLVGATTAGGLEAGQVLRMWKARGLIADWGKPGQLDVEPRYRFAISGTQDEQWSIAASILTGATFYIVPSSMTLRYDWQFVLTDLRSGSTYAVPVRRSATMWQHLVFVPCTPFGFLGSLAGQRDQAAYVWTELERQGAWAPIGDPAAQN